MEKISTEKERLKAIFRKVKDRTGKKEMDEIELRIISPKGEKSGHPQYRTPGRTTFDHVNGNRIVILNEKITKNMSDAGVKGLIAHEIAHFFSDDWSELEKEADGDISTIFERSEEEADSWAKSKGFEREIEVARSEINSLKES